MIERLRFATRRFAHEIDGEVRDDSVEPGEEARGPLEGLEAAVDAKEGFLDDLARVVFVPDEPHGDREGTALMPLDETAEGVGTTCAGLGDEDTIFFGLELSGLFVRRFSTPSIHGSSDTEIMGARRPCTRLFRPDDRGSWVSGSELTS